TTEGLSVQGRSQAHFFEAAGRLARPPAPPRARRTAPEIGIQDARAVDEVSLVRYPHFGGDVKIASKPPSGGFK
ncbi:MAG TPA: hypothetical protein VHS97_07970, partial [Isosphaeraceae bacterium]|nr:hypothetical protein [Isosphaeraceae bacterium]